MANEFVARNGLIAQNNSTISGSLTVTQGITGSLLGTASYAATASYVSSAAGANTTASFTNLSTWTFTHGLGNQGVVVQAYDTNWNQIIPQTITLTNTNTATITFSTAKSGYAIATLGGTTSIVNAVSASFATTASYYNEIDPIFVAKSASLATTGSNTFTGQQIAKTGAVSGFTHATTDYVGGSAGTVLYTTLGASTGNTYGAINVRTVGGFANGTLVLNNGGGSGVGINKTSANATLDVNGNTIITGSLTVSGSVTIVNGSVTMQQRPAFSVYGAGTTNNLTTTQNTDGTLNSNNYAVNYYQGSGLNSGSGVFTAPIAGLYQVTVVGRNSGYSAGISQLAVLKNNSNASGNVLMIEWAASSTMNHTGGSQIFNLAVNDTLRLKVLAGQINFDGNDNWSVAYIG